MGRHVDGANLLFHALAVEVGIGPTRLLIQTETDADAGHLPLKLHGVDAPVGLDQSATQGIEGHAAVHGSCVHVNIAHPTGKVLGHGALSARRMAVNGNRNLLHTLLFLKLSNLGGAGVRRYGGARIVFTPNFREESILVPPYPRTFVPPKSYHFYFLHVTKLLLIELFLLIQRAKLRQKCETTKYFPTQLCVKCIKVRINLQLFFVKQFFDVCIGLCQLVLAELDELLRLLQLFREFVDVVFAGFHFADDGFELLECFFVFHRCWGLGVMGLGLLASG